MGAPRKEGARITAHTVISPLDQYDHEHLGRQLEAIDTATVGRRQAEFLARRLGVTATRANILVGLVFGEVSR